MYTAATAPKMLQAAAAWLPTCHKARMPLQRSSPAHAQATMPQAHNMSWLSAQTRVPCRRLQHARLTDLLAVRAGASQPQGQPGHQPATAAGSAVAPLVVAAAGGATPTASGVPLQGGLRDPDPRVTAAAGPRRR